MVCYTYPGWSCYLLLLSLSPFVNRTRLIDRDNLYLVTVPCILLLPTMALVHAPRVMRDTHPRSLRHYLLSLKSLVCLIYCYPTSYCIYCCYNKLLTSLMLQHLYRVTHVLLQCFCGTSVSPHAQPGRTRALKGM